MRELFYLSPRPVSRLHIERIETLVRGRPSDTATTFSADPSIQRSRSCTVSWLSDDWLKGLVLEYIEEANRLAFQVDLSRQLEVQLVEYQADREDHYDWHHDVQWNGSSGLDRKLSMTIQLSDPKDYDGGDFEFEEVMTTADFRAKGTVLVFPAYLRHRITPVKRGTRRALVAWTFGPKWR